MGTKVICEFATGTQPEDYIFLCDIYSNGNAVEFFTDIECEVDWGDGQYYKYDAGVVQGFPKNYVASAVHIRSVNEIKKLYFGDGASYDDSIIEINIFKASTLEDAERMCYNLEKLTRFLFVGTNRVTTFESAWENCTDLIEFTGMSTVSAVTFKRAWKNASRLANFPSLYSKYCLTVEEAWMGCTNMVWFPIINVSKCLNFDNAWAGNVRLSEFPLIDTSSGISFNSTWSYCIDMLYFPTLDFSSANDMSYAFAYNYKVERYPAFNTSIGELFTSMFEKNTSLKCITAIDTSKQTDTTDMFKRTDVLVAPTPTEQFLIKSGMEYVNQNPCSYNAGRSRFFVMGVTNKELTTFTITGGNFEVDWGNGIFLNYNEGTVTGMPIDTNIISIRSEENITSFDINSDTFKSFSIKRGKDLLTLRSLFENSIMLEEFNIEAVLVLCTNMNSMLKNAINLVRVPGEIIYSYVLDAGSMLEGCSSFEGFDDEYSSITLNRCTNFNSFMKGCSSVVTLPNIVSTSGNDFDEAFRDMINLECMYGIDTRNITSGTNMFMNDIKLARPNTNEQASIIDPGKLYNNGGNCGALFLMSFTSSGEVTFTVDTDVQIDPGDGTFVPYSAGSITMTPTGTVYVMGDVTTLSFDTDTFTNVKFFMLYSLLSMNGMFTNMANIETVDILNVNTITDMSGMFKGSGIRSFSSTDGTLSTVINLNSMFMDTPNLTNVGNINATNGVDFEHIFDNTSIVCIGGINTSSAIFPKFDIACASEVACASDLKCWGDSTMFDNTSSIVSPNSVERDEIMSRSVFVSSQC